MNWKINKLTEQEINNIYNQIDNDLLIARICYELHIDRNELFKEVSEDVLKNVICNFLYNRRLATEDKINRILNNVNSCITSPHEIGSIDLFVSKLISYIKDGYKIYIYGDYDSDGILSTYIFYTVLSRICNNDIVYHVPERDEGYGLSIDFCNSLIESKKDDDKILVITVDNGVTKKNEVALLHENGIEVLISDHHTAKPEEIPDCIIVDPHCSLGPDADARHFNLCGAGIAFKICQVLSETYTEINMMEFTPFLAIATLADVMELDEENMAIIQFGLEIINSEYCPDNIKEIITQLKIDILGTKDVLWSIAPLINACGRMGNTALACKMFFEDDNKPYVKEALSLNESRKNITKKAKADLDKYNFDDNKVCIITTDKYPKGILGIIAGKSVEHFNKPSIVASLSTDGFYHGSIRSCNNINMFVLLKEMKELDIIEDYGGHAEACVCTFNIDNIDKMNNFFNEAINIEKDQSEDEIEETLTIDSSITLEQLNKVMFAISNVIPYDNKTVKNPTFSLENLKVIGYRVSRNNPNNIEFTFREGRKKYSIWAWGFGNLYINELKCPEVINIAGEITKSFMGSNYTLNVVDIIKA